jgi:hydroxymethylpyrimidine/phosphomethylpyrimidine kinase
MHTILTIAGFDPSGGAGVLADIKTFAALGCFGAAAITSVTAQNSVGVYAAYHQTPEILRAQLTPLLEDYDIAAVKIGMLPTSELIEVVAETLAQGDLKNVVIDPVLRSSSGYALVEEKGKQKMWEMLFRAADVITPNLDEVKDLLGQKPASFIEMAAAAKQISLALSTEKEVAVLVKGGHLQDTATDVLYAGRDIHVFTTAKLASRHTHGTGCTLSSAIAALLAHGYTLPEAVQRAKDFVTAAIKNAPAIGRGAGPMNHFYDYASNQSST